VELDHRLAGGYDDFIVLRYSDFESLHTVQQALGHRESSSYALVHVSECPCD